MNKHHGEKIIGNTNVKKYCVTRQVMEMCVRVFHAADKSSDNSVLKFLRLKKIFYYLMSEISTPIHCW